MKDNITALLIILCISIPASQLYKPFLRDAGILEQNQRQRYIAWAAITTTAFLSFNFWIFILSAGIITYWATIKEERPLVLWITLLLAAPVISRQISGFGLAKQIIAIDYVRLITLIILLPTAYKTFVSVDPSKPTQGLIRYVDISIIGYIAVQLMLRLSIDSFTNTTRFALYSLIDIGLPYYVASRTIKTYANLKQTLYAIWYLSLLTAALAIYEVATNKLLYGSLASSLNQYWGYGNALFRGDRLRAQSTTGQPIALGYVLMIGLCMHCFVAAQKVRPKLTKLIGMLLLAGLIASISRGPWIATAGALTTFVALSTRSLGGLFKFTIATTIICVIALNSPWAETIKNHLPFVGTVENENITYRQNLLDFSIQVIAQNPFFGAYDYLYHPALQSLRQETANGLIDVVNTYICIALSNGLVGLSFFLGAFVFSIYSCWIALSRTSKIDTWERNLGRTLLATLVGIMITIFTTSSVTVIPVFYWLIIGLAAGYRTLTDKLTATNAWTSTVDRASGRITLPV